jgi:hypothetical protein
LIQLGREPIENPIDTLGYCSRTSNLTRQKEKKSRVSQAHISSPWTIIASSGTSAPAGSPRCAIAPKASVRQRQVGLPFFLSMLLTSSVLTQSPELLRDLRLTLTTATDYRLLHPLLPYRLTRPGPRLATPTNKWVADLARWREGPDEGIFRSAAASDRGPQRSSRCKFKRFPVAFRSVQSRQSNGIDAMHPAQSTLRPLGA